MLNGVFASGKKGCFAVVDELGWTSCRDLKNPGRYGCNLQVGKVHGPWKIEEVMDEIQTLSGRTSYVTVKLVAA